ncbi:hypothetical protein [Sphingomonas psychrotolerans]|uniref:Uncharacterized protein n=1 Tax=Sphingomonas psychrotolerans TaxID=1327635 RepID=A0A2K8MAN6_9SPHN|nr:hypothetical protein [Sphingomonas psychrotolerans]ATY30940.1 hypothetical protein CVN68_02165 [Sphingomonas psychrotolerans]
MGMDWHLELKTALKALAGAVVTDAWVNEMALYGPEDAGHFTDPSLNFVQANVLELRTLDGGTIHISCVQDNDTWAIWPHVVSTDKQLSSDVGEGTFRTRPMPEFPRGSVSCFQMAPDDVSSIQEIRMTIDKREVILRAGEVYEKTDGTLSVCDRDESVLVLLDGEAYSQLKFNEPIYSPLDR